MNLHNPLFWVTLGFALIFLCGYAVGRLTTPTIGRDKKGRFVKK